MNSCKYCKADCALRGEENLKECKGYIPMSNADRIRSMDDEELATFISEIADECETNTECNQHCYGCDIEYCVHDSCLKWLQQPVKEIR